MIKSLWNYIKKFFAIIVSLFYGFVHNNQTDNSKKDDALSNKKISAQKQNKDENIDTVISSFEIPNSPKTLDYNIKYDLYKILTLIDKIEIIKQALVTVKDQDEIANLQKEILEIKSDLNYLEQKYNKIKCDNKQIIKINDEIDICKSIVKEVDKNLTKIKIVPTKIEEKENKILQEEQKIEEKENKISQEEPKIKEEYIKTVLEEQIETAIIDTKKDINDKLEIEKSKLKNIKENKVVKENKVIKEKEKKSKISNNKNIAISNNKKQTSKRNATETILHNIIIKEDIVEKEINRKDYENAKTNKSQIIESINVPNYNKKEKEKPKFKLTNPKKVKKYKVNLNIFKRKVNNLKTVKKQTNLIKKALKLTMMLEIIKLTGSKARLLATNIMINNCIRKARKVANKKVRLLKQENIIKKISKTNSVTDQNNYVIKNTLQQIEKLKQELYSMNLKDLDIIHLLEELEQLETNIRTNLEEEKQKAR